MTEPSRAGRRILLADADAFYVAVARYVDPDGAGREPLLIVGGSADGRGVVTSASYEARAYGVRSAMPTAQALRLCPGAVVAPVPRDVCAQKSREILDVLRDFSPVVEPASIDEFYVDLDGTEQLYHEPLAETAVRIRARVLDVTGLSVSIGGGPSKVIAKLAAKLAKPRPGRPGTGVCVVDPGGEGAFMEQFDLADIPMIGPRFQQQLARFGLKTVREALRHDQRTLEGWLGARTGGWLYHRVRGRDHSRVADGPRRKSVSHESTFARDLTRPEDLDARLVGLAGAVARDLRHKGRKARTITVKLRDADFTTRQASRTLPEPVNTDRIILDTARELLDRLRRARLRPARLLGVAASQLTPKGGDDQLALFGERGGIERARDQQLDRLMDGIADRFGRESMRRGIEIRNKKTAG